MREIKKNKNRSIYILCCIYTCSVKSESVISRTVAFQAPLSMGFHREDTGVGCHFILQGITFDINSRIKLTST